MFLTLQTIDKYILNRDLVENYILEYLFDLFWNIRL